MTIEIRELIVQVEVTETVSSVGAAPVTQHSEWDDQRWIDMIKQDVLEQLLERGGL